VDTVKSLVRFVDDLMRRVREEEEEEGSFLVKGGGGIISGEVSLIPSMVFGVMLFVVV